MSCPLSHSTGTLPWRYSQPPTQKAKETLQSKNPLPNPKALQICPASLFTPKRIPLGTSLKHSSPLSKPRTSLELSSLRPTGPLLTKRLPQCLLFSILHISAEMSPPQSHLSAYPTQTGSFPVIFRQAPVCSLHHFDHKITIPF